MWAVFMIPAAGVVLAALVLLLEILYYSKCYAGEGRGLYIVGCVSVRFSTWCYQCTALCTRLAALVLLLEMLYYSK